MPSPGRVVTAMLLLLIASAVMVGAQEAAGPSAAISNNTSDAAPAVGQGAGQTSSPYLLKKGDNEFGFGGGSGFKATTIFGGLHEDEPRDRRFFIAAFRYGRTLAANRHVALQYTLDAIPVAVATGDIVESTTVGTVTTFRRETAYGA